MNAATEMPDGLHLVRTTALWDEESVPAGVLSGHRVADGVWGQLVVRTGTVGAGDSVVIPPGRYHHVVLQGPATFAVEFYRKSKDQPSAPASS